MYSLYHTPRPSAGVAIGDLNEDTILDLVIANRLNAANVTCLGIGDGTFSECTIINSPVGSSFRVALEDMNGDGSLDAIFANGILEGGRANSICLGNGQGTLGLVQFYPP